MKNAFRGFGWHRALALFLVTVLLAAGLGELSTVPVTQAQGPVQFDEGIDPELWYRDHEIEHSWHPDYLHLATGDPYSHDHGVYEWPFALDSIGWNMQSYQNYGGTPYFHHGMDMMKIYGTQVYNRSGGQVINIENYQPGNDLYWEVAVLDPDGYIWQYHHIDHTTIPQYIWDKYYEYLQDPVNGGFIPPDTYIGNIVYWPVWSFGKQFNHIHLNILGAGGVYLNGFEFHVPLPDTVGPEIQAVGLLKDGQLYPGNEVEGDYSLYVRARDLILDDVYWLPPWEFTFSVDCGPVHTTWRFDTLPGGADRYAYVNDFYVVPPTCGNYTCRDFYVDLGFIPDSHFSFPSEGGEHTVHVTVRDYAGNAASQDFTYTVIAPLQGTLVWQDDLETERGWVPNPYGSDTATSGFWERGDPEDTYSGGPKQLGTTTSGVNDLVTGRLAGTNANSYDIDGGVTSIRSPAIALPVTDSLTLAFRYYLAHGSNSSSADYLRVKVVGTTTTTVFEELGAAENDNGFWSLKTVNLNAWAGQTIYLLIEAADGGSDSLVEAAVDDVVIVARANRPPTAIPQTVSTDENTPVDIVLSGYDLDCDPLSYSVVSGPQHGTLGGTAPYLTYTPTLNYSGPDAFAFVTYDGRVPSEPAVVSITVNPGNGAPVAYPQAVTTTEDTPLAITLAGSDPDDDPLTYSVVLGPLHGTLGGTAPNLVYTPTANYYGPDALTFIVNDGLVNSEPAPVTITVLPVNDAPVAYSQTVSVVQGQTVAITLAGWDVEGDELIYRIVSGPTHGTLSGTAPHLTYAPDPDYIGADLFTFVVNDGELDSAPAVVQIAIVPPSRTVVYLPAVLKSETESRRHRTGSVASGVR
ncbi:MAG: Ig-like domain-containing protein [Chloroflexia bacterium]